jgi:hypothetical protein
VSPALSSNTVTSPAQLITTNLPTDLATKLKEINPVQNTNVGIIDVAARIKVCCVFMMTRYAHTFGLTAVRLSACTCYLLIGLQ